MKVSVGRWTYLRPALPSDLDFLYRLHLSTSGSHVRFNGGTPSFEDFSRRAWDSVLAQWIVCRSRTDQPIGIVVLASPDFVAGHGFFTFLGLPEVVNTGLMIDAAAASLDLIFETWPFRMIYAEASESSAPAFSSAIGRFFEIEGIRRRANFRNGEFEDIYHLTLWREVWETEGRRLRSRLLRTISG